MIYRKKIEKICLELSLSLKKISSIDFFFIKSVRALYFFFDLIFFIIVGLFRKQYLNFKVITKLLKNNVVVFEQKKRNFVLKDHLNKYGLIYLSYSKNRTNNSRYKLSLGFEEYIKVIKLKLENFEINTNDIVKYISLEKGFNLLYKDLEMGKNYKFFSHEGFSFSHRLFTSFFKSKNFKTYIFFNNLNYSQKIPQLSNYIILTSEKAKKWVHKTDLSKVIVSNLDLVTNKFKTSNSSQIIKIAYLPEIHISKKNLLKEKFLLDFLIRLRKILNKDIELIIRDHPQIYKKKKKNLKSIYSHFNSKHFKLSFDDHSNDFYSFISDISCLFSAYYSTGVERALLIGKPCFVLENFDQICLKNNIIINDLLQVIKVEKKFNMDLLSFLFDERILKKNHQLLLKGLFQNLNKISIEQALNEK